MLVFDAYFEQAFEQLLDECLKDDFAYPFRIILAGDNGAFLMTECSEKSSETVLSHKTHEGFKLPIQIVVCDAAGKINCTTLAWPKVN